ncbi:MAG: sensor histidine kinase, partial [Calditrichaeota bacterium]
VPEPFQLAEIFKINQMLIYFLFFLLLVGLLLIIFRSMIYFIYYLKFIKVHLNNPNKAILFFSSNGKLIRFNQNAETMLNLPLRFGRGKSYKIVFRSLHQIQSHLQNLISNGQHLEEEFTLFMQNRILKGYLLGYAIKFLNKPLGFVLEIHDLSKEIISEREDLIHRLVRKMSHDIKTPLATVKFSVETLKYVIQNIEDEEVQEGLQNINQEVNRIQAITNNYSKIAQISRLRINIVDLKELCEELISQFHPPEAVSLLAKIHPTAQYITADADQLRVMFKELIENSLDAVGPEGEIVINTFPATIRNNKKSDAICINISDTGVGIPPGVKDKIFEPSFTTKTHGTGLGMVFVKQVVENHQGEIIVDSEINKGTKIQIILPKELK